MNYALQHASIFPSCLLQTAVKAPPQSVTSNLSRAFFLSLSFAVFLFSVQVVSALFLNRIATSSCQNLNVNFFVTQTELVPLLSSLIIEIKPSKVFFFFFFAKLNGVNRTDSFLYWKEDIFIALVNKCFQCTTKTKTLRHFFLEEVFWFWPTSSGLHSFQMHNELFL